MQFGRLLFAGELPPRAIVRIDEIEKMLAGAQGDTSGVSQDALGTILREMEDQNWAGLIAVGPPGSGKSAFSKTLGRTHGAPTFSLDLGAAKGSLVGQSEERIRSAMKVIKAVAGAGAFFVATCNKLDVLPPELRRRFRYGIWFFDLPKKAERESIWKINVTKFKLTPEQLINRPGAGNADDKQWTGAEIRNVCELASRMRCTVREAASFIVPVAISDPESITRLRTLAAGKFLSATYPGAYVLQAKETPSAPAVRSYQES
jgi:SpoVK/Ycf46/Vps4 family AAA+-type ATPase